MCLAIGAAGAVSLAATALSTASTIAQHRARADMQRADAEALKDEATAHAEKISAAVRREKGAARAAMAASGTQLDSFSEINTSDIERLGASDEAMTMLSGRRRARSLEYSAHLSDQAARYEAIGGFAEMGGRAYTGWKGAVKTTTKVKQKPEVL